MMPEPRRSLRDSLQRLPAFVIVLSGIVAALIVGASVYLIQGATPQGTAPSKTSGVTPRATGAATTPTLAAFKPNGPVSPLIWGTNLGLFDIHDQALYSTPTQALMQQMHVRIVRMPVRKELPEAVEVEAAQMIKNIGAAPLIALHGSATSKGIDTLSSDTQVIQDMSSIFGNSTVYYEFGNEDDFLGGKDAAYYTQQWNVIVPQLKRIAPHAQFIGPVNYQYSPNFLTTFLKGANPRPDEISWHEYTCSYKSAAEKCLGNIDKWTQHITDAHRIMQETIGTVLPIMITEWNYAPDQSIQSNGQPYNDGKYNNIAFMTAWTTKALKTLADNRVFASMQYSVTNTALPLISNDVKPTTQGATFAATYLQMVKQ